MARIIQMSRRMAIDLVLDEEQCPGCRHRAATLLKAGTWSDIPIEIHRLAQSIPHVVGYHTQPPEDRPVYHVEVAGRDPVSRRMRARRGVGMPGDQPAYMEQNGTPEQQAYFQRHPTFIIGQGWTQSQTPISRCRNGRDYATIVRPWQNPVYVAVRPDGRQSKRQWPTALAACQYSHRLRARWQEDA